MPWHRWLAVSLSLQFWVQSQAIHLGYVVNKVAVGLVFPQIFQFSCQLSFHQCSILIIEYWQFTLGWIQECTLAFGTLGQKIMFCMMKKKVLHVHIYTVFKL